MSNDTAAGRIAEFCGAWNDRSDLVGSYGKHKLRTTDLCELLAENQRLRAENAALLDGNQRLQTMNEGLRQMAIEAREAAEGWHRATIDLYSGRAEPHPTNCPCGR